MFMFKLSLEAIGLSYTLRRYICKDWSDTEKVSMDPCARMTRKFVKRSNFFSFVVKFNILTQCRLCYNDVYEHILQPKAWYTTSTGIVEFWIVHVKNVESSVYIWGAHFPAQSAVNFGGLCPHLIQSPHKSVQRWLK